MKSDALSRWVATYFLKEVQCFKLLGPSFFLFLFFARYTTLMDIHECCKGLCKGS